MGFSHKYSYGLRENPEIIFTSDRTGRQRAITDKKGRFVGFPGIVKEKEWTSHLTEEGCLDPVIRYRTDFVKFDDHSYMILWEVQPDGRYWADEDGFGMTSDEEICLYALLDLDGNYIGPFRVYKVGVRRYVERPQKPEPPKPPQPEKKTEEKPEKKPEKKPERKRRFRIGSWWKRRL